MGHFPYFFDITRWYFSIYPDQTCGLNCRWWRHSNIYRYIIRVKRNIIFPRPWHMLCYFCSLYYFDSTYNASASRMTWTLYIYIYIYIYILFLNIYHTWLVVWSMFYFPFHIWDNPSHGLSYFSRRLLHHQPDTAWITINPCEPPKCQSSEDISWKLCAVSFLPLMFNSMVTGRNWQLYHGRVPWLSWPITNIGWINGNSRIQQIGGTVPYKTIFCGDIPSHRPYIW